MTEAERIKLYNDLCDYEEDLRMITYPSQTKAIDIIHRAVIYVRGVHANWLTSNALPILDENNKVIHYENCICSSCGFAHGTSTYRICPSCGARMAKNKRSDY